MSTQNKVLVAALVTVFICALAAFTLDTSQRDALSETDQTAVAQSVEATVSIEGTAGVMPVTLEEGGTVLDALEQLDAADDRVQLRTRDYPGLGTLVEGLNGRMNGESNAYWQYTVNGVMPQIGADQLELAEGDAILWLFTTSDISL